MNQRSILLLVGVLVVLLLAAWLSGIFGGAPSTVETPQLALRSSGIKTITIRKGDSEIVARRLDDGTWQLESPVVADVDTTASSAFLSRLGSLRIENLVSSRTDRYDKFQVDSAQATYIRLDGETPAELYVGKMGPDFQSRYIRLGDDERIFLATDVPSADPTVDRWRDKVLWSNPKEGIAAVSVTTPDASFRLVGGDTGWMMERDGATSATDSAKVDRYLTRLANVKADGFLLDLTTSAVIDSTTHAIEVDWLNGSTSRIDMKERESNAAAVASGVDGVIKLFTYRVKSLAPAPEDLLPSED